MPGPADGAARFRALFEDAPVGVALSAVDGRFVQVNPALRELLLDAGVDVEAGELTDLARYLPEGADESRAWREALSDVRAGRVPVARAELAVSTPGSPPRWVRVTSAVIEFSGRAYLLSHLEETTGRRRAARPQLPLDRRQPAGDVVNPDLFGEQLARARARAASSGLGAAVLVVGPDPLAPPSLGVDADALVAVGELLRAVLRSADTVARLDDGPVFAVVAADVPDHVALDRLVARLEAVFAHPARCGRTGAALAVGVGGTLIRTTDSGAAAVRRAAEALAAAWRDRPPEQLDLRETDLRETDLREPGEGRGGTDGEAPLAERQR